MRGSQRESTRGWAVDRGRAIRGIGGFWEERFHSVRTFLICVTGTLVRDDIHRTSAKADQTRSWMMMMMLMTASSPCSPCRWLAGFDVTGTSPVLSFARATALGYGSRGDPATCYRAFPRCPRNPDKLVHYLNNHNGGFFRFFSRSGHGSYAEPPDVSRGTCMSLCTVNASKECSNFGT